MKKIIYTLMFTALAAMQSYAQSDAPVVVGGAEKGESNATMEILSKKGTKGFMPPRMTTAQVQALTLKLNAASEGLTVFNTDTDCLQSWKGSSWSDCASAGPLYDLTSKNTALTVTGGGKLLTADTALDIAGGTAGQVLSSNGTSSATWKTFSGDNLGDHSATKSLMMNYKNILDTQVLTFANYTFPNNDNEFTLEYNGAGKAFTIRSLKGGLNSALTIDETSLLTSLRNLRIYDISDGDANKDAGSLLYIDINGNVKKAGTLYDLTSGNTGVISVTGGGKIITADTSIDIVGGTAGEVLTSSGVTGSAMWKPVAGDNLGDHKATKELDMNGKDVNNVKNLYFPNTYPSPSSEFRLGNTGTAFEIWSTKADKFALSIDPTNLTTSLQKLKVKDVPTGTIDGGSILYVDNDGLVNKFPTTGLLGDDLGNHTATTTLNMKGNTIDYAGLVKFYDTNLTNPNYNTGYFQAKTTDGVFNLYSNKYNYNAISIDERNLTTLIYKLRIESVPAAPLASTYLLSIGNDGSVYRDNTMRSPWYKMSYNNNIFSTNGTYDVNANIFHLGSVGIAPADDVFFNTSAPTNLLHIRGGSNPLRLEGLRAGAGTDQVLSVDATGVVRTMPREEMTGGVAFTMQNAMGGGNTVLNLGSTTLVSGSGINVTVTKASRIVISGRIMVGMDAGQALGRGYVQVTRGGAPVNTFTSAVPYSILNPMASAGNFTVVPFQTEMTVSAAGTYTFDVSVVATNTDSLVGGTISSVVHRLNPSQVPATLNGASTSSSYMVTVYNQ